MAERRIEQIGERTTTIKKLKKCPYCEKEFEHVQRHIRGCKKKKEEEIRERLGLKTSKIVSFECPYCYMRFSSESVYFKHKCRTSKRYDILQTMDGKTALEYYKLWMFCKKRRLIDPQEAFILSNSFGAIFRFVYFVKKNQFPFPELFIKRNAERDYPPFMWLMDEVYAEFFENFDKLVPPKKQVNSSVKLLSDIAEDNDVDISEVFLKILPGDMYEMIKTRRLSPWLLLCSQKFKKYYRTVFSEEQRKLSYIFLNPKQWNKRFSNDKDTVKYVKNIIKEMGV